MWRRVRRALAAALLVVAFTALTSADVLHMKDGRRVEGQITKETSSEVTIRTRLGTLDFKTSEIARIERGKSKLEDFEERWQAAKSADDFHTLGLWAEQKRMRKEARKCMRRAVELDAKHAAANTWLGFVEYKGDWITPEERDKRRVADAEAEMRAKGLVRYADRWVTPEERAKLEAGLVSHEGQWIPFADAQRAKGLEEFGGVWMERTEAIARTHAAHAEVLAEVGFSTHVNAQALIAGPLSSAFLDLVGEGILRGRAWFDEELGARPGLALLGDVRAEIYIFGTQSGPYARTIDYFASLTPTLPEGWSAAAGKSHGFFWIDPYALSSARQWHRGMDGLAGHCYHHWGHMLLGRLGYDGRLLPPWYDESFASLCEFNTHGRNAVFCRATTTASGGTVSNRIKQTFDPKLVREGKWREALKRAISEGGVLSFSKLSVRDYSQLEVVDIATGMGILEWIDSHGDEALAKFHAAIRKRAPRPPERILSVAHERQAASDEAFRAATGKGWLEADRAWRKWFMEQ